MTKRVEMREFKMSDVPVQQFTIGGNQFDARRVTINAPVITVVNAFLDGERDSLQVWGEFTVGGPVVQQQFYVVRVGDPVANAGVHVYTVRSKHGVGLSIYRAP